MKTQRLLTASILGLGLTLALLWLLAAGPIPVVRAASITVNTADDELNSDGDCSLREAIRAANSDSAVDACTAGSGADTVTLGAGLYRLSIAGTGEDAAATGDLDINDDLVINGAGADVTIIDANQIDRALHVHSGNTVEINGVTITNGNPPTSSEQGWGGGIYNAGTLTLNNCAISDNQTSGGAKGGGIYNEATLTLHGSTVSSNTTGDDWGASGGGMCVQQGSLTLNNSTVSGNTAGAYGHGGVIYVGQGDLTLNNSTVKATPPISAAVASGIPKASWRRATASSPITPRVDIHPIVQAHSTPKVTI